MTNWSDYTHITILISRFLAKVASDEELSELNAWKNRQVENEQLINELTEKKFWEQKIPEMKKRDIVGAYLKVMEKSGKRKVRRILKKTILAAAALVLPLAAGIWWGLQQAETLQETYGKIEMQIVPDSILPGEIKAELLLADGSKIHLDGKTHDSLAIQAGSMIVAGGEGLKYTDYTPGEKLIYNTLKIPRGGEYTLTLGDGTVVYLNSESELKYPVQFVGDERKVELTGEAYFEVQADPRHPFIVRTIHSEVKVLGTTFNLRSYADENHIAATLVTGKIDFMTDNRQKVILSPGEQAVLDEQGQVTKREVNTYLYTAWKDGNFVFYKQTLEEVMRVISRWYDVEVHFIDASQRDVVFTGNVKRYDDFSKIVHMLEITGNTRFSINGKNIFIHEK